MTLFKLVSSGAIVLACSVPTLAQNVNTADQAGTRTVVRCTQNSGNTNDHRYNLRVVQIKSGALIADLHVVDSRTNFGHTIFTTPVKNQVVSRDPLTVTFWNENNSFILKVAAKYARGNSIIDYSGPGVMQAEGVNVFMNCFTVVGKE